MTGRVLGAGLGTLVVAALVAAALATSPVRPSGPVLALALIAGVVPATALAGARLGLRVIGQDDTAAAGRLAAVTAPVLVLVGVFVADLVAVAARPGAQQLAAMVIGTSAAAALSARFTGAAARREELARDQELLGDGAQGQDPSTDGDGG